MGLKNQCKLQQFLIIFQLIYLELIKIVSLPKILFNDLFMKKIIIGAALLAGFVNINAQTAKKDSLKEKQIEEVELFGERGKQNKGMEVITRIPLKIRDQI